MALSSIPGTVKKDKEKTPATDLMAHTHRVPNAGQVSGNLVTTAQFIAGRLWVTHPKGAESTKP